MKLKLERALSPIKLVLFCSKHALQKWVYFEMKARRDVTIMFRAWNNLKRIHHILFYGGEHSKMKREDSYSDRSVFNPAF